MKKLYLLALLLLLVATRSYSQYECTVTQSVTPPFNPQVAHAAGSCKSNNGYCHTPKGNLHIMMVFVDFNNDIPDADTTWWPIDGLPDYATGTPNSFFDVDPNAPSNANNMTTFYRTMSDGKFSVTAEIFKVKIDKIYYPGTTKPDQAAIENEAIKALQSQLQHSDLSRFDKRQNNPYWNYDNSSFNFNGTPASGDGVIDYVVTCLRLDHTTSNSGYAGTTYFGNRSISLTSDYGGVTKTYQMGTGHTLWHKKPLPNHKEYFAHEFSHNLFDAAHYMGANSLTSNKYYGNSGWGMMRGEFGQLLTANAWEKWWLGWIDMDNPRLFDGKSRTITPLNNQGTYLLKDFVTYNDALRIQIPNTNYYLWLENHQLINAMDAKMIFAETNPPGKGIYAFISEEQAMNCSNPTQFRFGTADATNGFKVLSRKGNWDYTWTARPGGDYDFTRVSSNYIGGTTDVCGVRGDYNNNDTIATCTNTNSGCPGGDEITGVAWLNGVYTGAFSGSPEDVFQLNDEIGINGIVPAMNYPKLASNVMEPYILNGLSVKIIAFNASTKEYTIQVNFNEFNLNTSKRFAASGIELPNLTNNTNPDLTVKTGVTMTIDKSGTSNTNLSTTYPDFIVPTKFVVKTGAFLKAEPGATIVVKNGATLKLDAGSKLELFNGSQLKIENGGRLEVNQNAQLFVNYGAIVYIQSGGRLVYNKDAQLNLQENGIIEVKDGGKIEVGPNASFQWTDKGFLRFNTNSTISNFVASTPNSNATVNIRGIYMNGGWNHKMIEVVSGALSIDKSLSKFSVISGVIKMGPYTKIDVDPEMDFAEVKVNTINPNTKFSGVWVYGQQSTPYLRSCAIDNADVGLRVFSVKGISPIAKVLNTNFNSCDVGMLVYGKSAEVIDGTFWNNKTGLFLDGVQNVNTVSGSQAYGNRSAVDVIGSGTDLLNLRGVYFYSNSAVGTFAINSTVSPGCSRLTNNYPNSSPSTGHNIYLREYSTLAIEPATWKDAEKNNLSNAYSRSIGALTAKNFYLDKGKTDFNTPAMMSIEGTLQKNAVPYPTVMASQNFWNIAGAAPVLNVDYSVIYQTTGMNLLKIDGAGQLTATPNMGSCNTGTGIWTGVDNPSAFIGKPSFTLQDGSTILQKFKSGLSSLYSSSRDYVKAIDQFTDIITYPYTASQFSQWRDVIELAHQKTMEALGQGVANGTIASDGYAIDPVQKIFNAQGRMIQYLHSDPLNFETEFKVNLDQAMIWRLINSRGTALEMIRRLQGNERNTETISKLLNYYECMITHEINILNSTGKEEYKLLDECREILNTNIGIFLPSGQRPADPVLEVVLAKSGNSAEQNDETPEQRKERISVTDNIRIYPNPTNDIVHIDLPSGVDVNRINITDIAGKLRQSTPVQPGSTHVLLYMNEDNGIYIIEVMSANGIISKKKVVIVK